VSIRITASGLGDIMLRTTLIMTTLAFLALAAHAEQDYNRGYSKHKHCSQSPKRPIPPNNYRRPTQSNLLESLKIFNATDEYRVNIEGGNEKDAHKKGISHLAAVTIAYKEIFINCTDNDVAFPVLHLGNQTKRATADFNTAEMDNCSSVIPPGSDIHVECNFDGARYFDGILNYTEEELGDETNGQIEITQASAMCTVKVSTDDYDYEFDDLAGGELTRARQKGWKGRRKGRRMR
jgi:hypothetical protein